MIALMAFAWELQGGWLLLTGGLLCYNALRVADEKVYFHAFRRGGHS